MPKKNKPQGDIPYVVPGSVDPDAYEATDKETKKARRKWARENQAWILQELSRGKSLADLGITDEKEGGRSMYRMLGMRGEQGFQNPNFTYDWSTGMKRDHATSNVNGRGWVPITAEERAEYEAQRQFGTGPDAWVKRLQAQSQAQLRTWAAQNATKGGSLRQDEQGRFYMSGDNGERIDFDAYGNLIDANTGSIIGDQYGMGTDLLSQARGYKSPYAMPGATPATPTYADSPSASNGPGTTPTPTNVPPTNNAPIAPMKTPLNTGMSRSAWGSGQGGISVAPSAAIRKPTPIAAQQSTMRPQPIRAQVQPKQRQVNAYGSYGVF